MHHVDIVRHEDIPLKEVEIQTHAPIIQHLPDQIFVMLSTIANVNFAGAELGHPLVPRFEPTETGLVVGRMRHYEREICHVVVPVGAVPAVPFEISKFGKSIRGWQMLKDEPGVCEEGLAIAGWGGGDGGKVLETRDLRDLLFNPVNHFFLEEEKTVVVHGHRFTGGDGAGFWARVYDFFDGDTDAPGPGLDCAGVVGLGFECVPVCCFGETAQDNWRAGFG